MNELIDSCEKFEHYPQNLIYQRGLRHRIQGYVERLQNEAARIFNESQVAVDVLEYDELGQESRSCCVTDLDELKKLLRDDLEVVSTRQKSRYIFLHAPHSRAALRISLGMLKFLFTYHQVMPDFLDFIFPFGKQEAVQDFYFSGLKEDSFLEARTKGLELKQIGRSGLEIRLCYNLRSVEKSTTQHDLPWSIRQTAIYHSFDLETGQSLWINVKGNKLMKNRVSEASESRNNLSQEPTSRSFSASLDTHALFCDWSGENWRWYINDLEAKLHEASKATLVAPVDRPLHREPMTTSPFQSPGPYLEKLPKCQRTSATNSSQVQTSPELKSEKALSKYQSRAPTLLNDTPERSQLNRNRVAEKSNHSHLMSLEGFYRWIRNHWFGSLSSSTSKPSQIKSDISSLHSPDSGSEETKSARMLPPELPTAIEDCNDIFLPDAIDIKGRSIFEKFTFSNLQHVQHIEEKIQEALLALKLNANTLQEVRHYYRSTIALGGFPVQVRQNCESNIAAFSKHLSSVEKDIDVQQNRTETLMCKLADRKRLLHDILEYRSVKANEKFAKMAQFSADKMETITGSMHEIAQKTKQETVSMRVITSVTLFFLPGTFVATFLSTDIVRLVDKKKEFQLKGLKIYLAICLPMMAITFLTWYLMYRIAKRRDQSSKCIMPIDYYSNSV